MDPPLGGHYCWIGPDNREQVYPRYVTVCSIYPTLWTCVYAHMCMGHTWHSSHLSVFFSFQHETPQPRYGPLYTLCVSVSSFLVRSQQLQSEDQRLNEVEWSWLKVLCISWYVATHGKMQVYFE